MAQSPGPFELPPNMIFRHPRPPHPACLLAARCEAATRSFFISLFIYLFYFIYLFFLFILLFIIYLFLYLFIIFIYLLFFFDPWFLWC